MTEQWRPVLGMEGLYEVSDLGRVRSLRSGRVSTLNKQSSGYVLAHFYVKGAHTARYVHILVLEAFVGPRPTDMETLHRNNVRGDNRLANLRWGTKAENERDKVRHGTRLLGEKSSSAKLTESEVLAIRARAGATHEQLAREFGCSVFNISAIKRRRTWTHV